MRILVLGGTVFVGRAVTDAALSRGHEVTHFNRGRSGKPDGRVEALHGDRFVPADLERAFARRDWDAVIDTSCYMPQAARHSSAALRDKAARYLFVSSISAYASLGHPGTDESAPLFPHPDPLPETLDMAIYGPLKSACEAAVATTWGDRSTVVRPGLIVGPHDSTDRFTYWPVRAARGGTILAPGRPSRAVQFIDVRDLADWMLRLAERGLAGAYNATGPRAPTTMEELLQACIDVGGAPAELAWRPDGALLAAGARPWVELPLWLPESDEAHAGMMAIDCTRALDAGLAFRPVAQTVADTLAWANARPPGHEWKAGMSAEREAALLAVL